MAKGKILITRYKDALVSILTDSSGKAVSINAETECKKSIVGNIYACNVTDIVKGIGGAFAEYEKGKRAFFHLGEGTPFYVNGNRRPGGLRQGDIILLQAEADSVKQKDPLFSTDISIPGRYAVLVPGDSEVRFSSRIKDDGFKERFAEAFAGPAGPGFIIRTAAGEAEIALTTGEMDRLCKCWTRIMENARHTGQVYKSPDFYLTDIMENVSSVDRIVTDDAECAVNIRAFLEERYPEEAGKVEALNSLKAPLKTLYGVEHMMDEALKKTVWLKSGAFLVIEPTEALTVIDVNSGSASGRDFLEINLEAAKEAARQIRLRNISGMIVIDFINLRSEADKRSLLKTMREYLETDPLRPQAVDVTKLGLMELTRKKVRRPLYETMDFC